MVGSIRNGCWGVDVDWKGMIEGVWEVYGVMICFWFFLMKLFIGIMFEMYNDVKFLNILFFFDVEWLIWFLYVLFVNLYVGGIVNVFIVLLRIL